MLPKGQNTALALLECRVVVAVLGGRLHAQPGCCREVVAPSPDSVLVQQSFACICCSA